MIIWAFLTTIAIMAIAALMLGMWAVAILLGVIWMALYGITRETQ